MTSLFISFERETLKVTSLIEGLREEKYRLWYDREGILSDNNKWQKFAEQAISKADAVILCIESGVSISKRVCDEVDIAISQRKLIVPVVFEVPGTPPQQLSDLGLQEKHHCQIFAEDRNWGSCMRDLINFLACEGVVVTRHGLDLERETKNRKNYQVYLHRLIESIGNLHPIFITNDSSSTYLEDVYVQLPTEMTLHAKIDRSYILEWWLSSGLNAINTISTTDSAFSDAKWDASPMDTLVEQEYHKHTKRTKKQGRSDYIPSMDDDSQFLQKSFRLLIEDVAAACSRLVILGGPGTGKSMCVRYLVLCLAGEQLLHCTRNLNLNVLRTWTHKTLTPVYIEWSSFVSSNSFPDELEIQPTLRHLMDYLKKSLLSYDPAGPRDEASDFLADYEFGLDKLESRIGGQHPRYQEYLVYEQRLRENIQKVRLWGDSADKASNRAEIINYLNSLSQDVIGESFNELSRGTPAVATSSEMPLPDFIKEIEADIVEGKALIVLDGLDEIPYQQNKLNLRRMQLKSMVATLSSYGSRIIVTSRIYAYSDWELPGFFSVQLAPLRNHDIRSIANKLFRITMKPDDASNETSRFVDTLTTIDSDLKNSPLFITLLVALFQGKNQEMPSQEGELFKEILLLLLGNWTQRKSNTPSLREMLGNLSIEELIERLATIAYKVHAQLGTEHATPIIPVDLLYSYMFRLGLERAVDAVTLLHYLSKNTGILLSIGKSENGDMFRFAHRSFQEYLSSIYIAEQCKQRGNYDYVRELISSNPILWRIPCLLIPHVLRDKNTPHEIWRLLEDLISECTDTVTPDSLKSHWPVWLAGKIAERERLTTGESRGYEGFVLTKLQSCLGKVLSISGKTDISQNERYDIGKVLALSGDKRLGVGVDANGIAQIHWCEIKSDDQEPFFISLYPITYQQYLSFLTAKDGHNDEIWWRGLYHRQDVPGNQTNKSANAPVDNISWYDALVFCRWLSSKFGYEVSLPTEEQWELVARAKNQTWNYPWGEGYISGYANIDETARYGGSKHGPNYLGHTVAVGIYPESTSPYGVMDLIGNVWEWTLTAYTFPNNYDLSINITRVLKGGGWDSTASQCVIGARMGLDPFSRSSNIGFRICKRMGS
ncbi:SUMF1/EgtB/PvdO family nonheme iron enzyme [Chloroflexales bacterium ZM16-3]|nr:SUMF1/EgtB/PvdO family nonheme iron enzyme [Chloroflexales bacterium ZM16-3]